MRLTREDLERWSDAIVARPIDPHTPPVLDSGSEASLRAIDQGAVWWRPE